MESLRWGIQRLVIASRGVHHKVSPKAYPQVNIKDVALEKPRYGFRKKLAPLLSQSIKNEIFPAEKIKQAYLEAGKPVPIKFSSKSDAIARRNYEFYKESVSYGLPHFKVGEKKVYLPKARICLLRPNAKHTPYQAKFLVPRNFNKMDLRDYLWHVYGLRALNVTVQLLHARFTRGMNDHARYRAPQYKKMTVDMENPFIWPELPEGLEKRAENMIANQMEAAKMINAIRSDKAKPNDAFDGLYKKPELPNIFVTRRTKRAVGSLADKVMEAENISADRAAVARYLNL